MEQDRENRRAASVKMGTFSRPPSLPPRVRTPPRFPAPPKDMTVRIQTVLAGLAKFSGGWAGFLETPEQANDVYTRILSGINSRYVIGYYPINEKRDGARRTIKIEVREHPEYIVWGRKTYFAPEPEK